MPAAEKVLFEGFHPASKLWIYASDRVISPAETSGINDLIARFAGEWTSHDVALKAAGAVFNNRFVVLCVDESRVQAGGCSIDKSIHFIQALEKTYGLKLFDRLHVYYLKEGQMHSFHLNDLKNKIAAGEFSPTMEIFDTTLIRLGDFLDGFVKPASQSWLRRFMD